MAAGFGKVFSLALPSGNKVRVRRGSILTLVKGGQLPSNLIGAVWQHFGQAAPTSAQEIASDPERITSVVAVMEASVRAVLVNPKVTDEPTETSEDAEGYTVGHVNPGDIPDNDKVVLFGFTQGLIRGLEEEPLRAPEGSPLAQFPAEPGSQAGGSGSEAVRPAPELADPPAA